ncbi:hypothetical protein BGZ70_002496 [Mortierella alpina]|uniref:BHLH domain-containing protein n=1 Tax=Mortierella alpina TaxID=64518 RepID=A0A9P6IU36_MORAP|nr:hypothetical protein BGZ70_002496 [Mortierella alpina]
MHFGATASEFGYVQHINIQNHNDEDSNMSGDDQEEEDGDDGGNCTDSSANSIRGGMDIKTGPGYNNQSYHHYRSSTNTAAHLSRGFTALHGFTPIISPGSNNSPPFSPGSESFTSDSGSAFGSSFPLHPSSGNSYNNNHTSPHHNNNTGNNHNVALESSLSSLAALSVMADPLFRRSLSSGNTSQLSQNPLPGMYQDHQQQTSFEMGSRTNSNGIDSMQTFTSALAPRKYHGRQTRQVPIVTNVVKEVVAPTRRMAHILSEQKRREKINGGFDELKSVIPECADNTDSKASILRKAVDYICLLEDEIRKYVEVYEPDHGGDFGDQRHSED